MYVSLVVETDLFRLHVRNWIELQYFLKHSAFLIKHHFDSPIIVISFANSEVLLKIRSSPATSFRGLWPSCDIISLIACSYHTNELFLVH